MNGAASAMERPVSTWCWKRRVPELAAQQRRESVEKKLFVGNLPYSMTDEDLERAFA
ncbi:MAG TPA: RNA-binding protein, partial [Acidobacteria bacterium]|nr:RNA-binding protein [Acidobacteriota bacterium]